LVTNGKTTVNLAEYFVIEVVLLKNLLKTLFLFNGVHCSWGRSLDRSRPGKGSGGVSRVIMVLYCLALRAMETVRVLSSPIFNFIGIKSLEIVGKASVEGLVIFIPIVILQGFLALHTYALLPAHMMPLEGQRS